MPEDLERMLEEAEEKLVRPKYICRSFCPAVLVLDASCGSCDDRSEDCRVEPGQARPEVCEEGARRDESAKPGWGRRRSRSRQHSLVDYSSPEGVRLIV